MGLRDSGMVAADLTLGLLPTSSQYHHQYPHHRQLHHPHHHHHHHRMRELVPDLKTLQLYHRALEEERHKIRAFERELPFCMQLLDHAIEASREQLADRLTCKLDLTPSPDNFLLDCSAASAGGPRMRRPSLPALMQGEAEHQQNPHYQLLKKLKRESPASHAASADQHPPLDHYQQALQGPHQEEQADQDPHYRPQHHPHHDWLPAKHLSSLHLKDSVSLQEMATKGKAIADCYTTRLVGNGVVDVNTPMEDIATRILMPKEQITGAQCSQRKPRRCWSPDLHQRFLNALHQLGGCQAATPKQIRELMNVEGLTNDEVKSHLQKFRLHMRRPSLASQGDSPQEGHHLLVFGHVWMPESSTSPSSNYANSGNTLSSFAQAMNYHSTMLGQERLSNFMEVSAEHSLILPPKSCLQQQEKLALDEKRESFDRARLLMEELHDEQMEDKKIRRNAEHHEVLKELQNDDFHKDNDVDDDGRSTGTPNMSPLIVEYMHTSKEASRC